MRHIKIDSLKLKSIDILDPKILNDFDACAIITDHSNIDYKNILNSSMAIIDTRNVLDNNSSVNVRRLGEG